MNSTFRYVLDLGIKEIVLCFRKATEVGKYQQN